MLSMLIPMMPEEQVVAEAKTMFNAGHDSTAAALAWCWYLLLRNTDIYERATTSSATYLTQIAKEALRLYPPAWVIPRQAAETTELAGFEIPKGSFVNVFPWVIQRDSRFFAEPEKFDPDRFSSENEHQIYPFAWFPFGAGGRACIGRELALMEMEQIMTLVNQRFRLKFAPDQSPDVEPNPLISLEPRNGIKVQIDVR
jgi:cytochrome P450